MTTAWCKGGRAPRGDDIGPAHAAWLPPARRPPFPERSATTGDADILCMIAVGFEQSTAHIRLQPHSTLGPFDTELKLAYYGEVSFDRLAYYFSATLAQLIEYLYH
jgi:hypothetical protein